MAKRHVIFIVLWTAALVAARPAVAIIPGVETDRPFDAPNSPWRGMAWEYVYQTGAGTSVAVGYFSLLTARHCAMENGDILTVNGDEFEVVRRQFLPRDAGAVSPPDLCLLQLRNNTDPMRPLPGYYELYAGRLDVNLEGNMLIVGTGLSGEGHHGIFYREDASTGRAKRWGTNSYSGAGPHEDPAGLLSTRCFQMDFHRGHTPHECGYGEGDSGGGVFVKAPDGEWRLAGINLYRDGIEGWYRDMWAASMPAYAHWLNGVLAEDVLPGDADLDGDVDFRDYLRVKASLGRTPGANWRDGDFNHDRRVDREDFRAIVMNFGYTSPGHPAMTPPIWPGAGDGLPAGALPEPGALGVLAAGALALLRRRSRRRR